MQNILKWLTLSIAALAGAASTGGLMIPGLYRDTAFYKAAWQANDLITFFAAPAMLVSFHYYSHGNAKARLIWLGLLLYMFYNYAFYLFGAAFNWFFLIYAALFTISLYALLLGLSDINTHAAHYHYAAPLKRKAIIAFLFLVAIPLAVVELAQCLDFILSGTPPKIPSLIMALDLTLVIPNTVLAALLLMGKRPWGIILSAMMLVKSFTYGLVLVAGTTFIAITDAGPWDPLLPFYLFVSAGGLVFLWILLKDLDSVTSLDPEAT